MDEIRKRRFFQIHLSTALAMMLAAAICIGIQLVPRTHKEDFLFLKSELVICGWPSLVWTKHTRASAEHQAAWIKIKFPNENVDPSIYERWEFSAYGLAINGGISALVLFLIWWLSQPRTLKADEQRHE